VVKQYDFELKQWVKVAEKVRLEPVF
jgi:hypothetical protein